MYFEMYVVFNKLRGPFQLNLPLGKQLFQFGGHYG